MGKAFRDELFDTFHGVSADVALLLAPPLLCSRPATTAWPVGDDRATPLV